MGTSFWHSKTQASQHIDTRYYGTTTKSEPWEFWNSRDLIVISIIVVVAALSPNWSTFWRLFLRIFLRGCGLGEWARHRCPGKGVAGNQIILKSEIAVATLSFSSWYIAWVQLIPLYGLLPWLDHAYTHMDCKEKEEEEVILGSSCPKKSRLS